MDKFQTYGSSLDSPAREVFAIVPHNTNDLAVSTRALYVGVAGDVAVVMVDDSQAVFKGAVGLLPLRVKRVRATGTTATNIIGLV